MRQRTARIYLISELSRTNVLAWRSPAPLNSEKQSSSFMRPRERAPLFMIAHDGYLLLAGMEDMYSAEVKVSGKARGRYTLLSKAVPLQS